MSVFKKLQNPDTLIRFIGERSLEERPLSFILSGLIEQFDKVTQTPWMMRTYHSIMERIRTPLIETAQDFLEKSAFLVNSIMENTDLLHNAKRVLKSKKIQHHLLQKLDGFLTLGMANQALQKTDQTFLNTLHQTGFTTESYPVFPINSYGTGSAMAQTGKDWVGKSGHDVIYIEKTPKGDINLMPHPLMAKGWKRLIVLAHEAGHIEYRKRHYSFFHPQMHPVTNELFSRYITREKQPFSLALEEMTVDTFAVATLLKMSHCSPEALEQARFYQEIRNQDTHQKLFNFWKNYDERQLSELEHSISFNKEQNTSYDIPSDTPFLNGAGKACTALLKENPYLWCQDGLEKLLQPENLEKLKTIEPQHLLTWVRELTADILMDKISNQSISYKTKSGTLKDSFKNALMENLKYELNRVNGYERLVPYLHTLILNRAIGYDIPSFAKTIHEQYDDSKKISHWLEKHQDLLNQYLDEVIQQFPQSWMMVQNHAQELSAVHSHLLLSNSISIFLDIPLKDMKEAFSKKVIDIPSLDSFTQQLKAETRQDIRYLQTTFENYFNDSFKTSSSKSFEKNPEIQLSVESVMNQLQQQRSEQNSTLLNNTAPRLKNPDF